MVKDVEIEAFATHEARIRLLIAAQMCREHGLRMLVRNFVAMAQAMIDDETVAETIVNAAEAVAHQYEDFGTSRTSSEWTLTHLMAGVKPIEDPTEEAMARMHQIVDELVATFPVPKTPDDLDRVSEWLIQFVTASDLEKSTGESDSLTLDLNRWLDQIIPES